MAKDQIALVSPRAVMKRVAESIPPACKDNVVIIGSLAAGFQLLGSGVHQIRTKDVDCLLSPRVEAVGAGTAVAELLFQSNWQMREEGKFQKPGTAKTPDRKLPAVRLHPPDDADWFIELLTLPISHTDRRRRFLRITTSRGHFGLPSFGFLPIATYKPKMTEFGIAVARPEMMALANLLENPRIKKATMSGLIEGRTIKRSNKDLGRVLAIARLSDERIEQWAGEWLEALKACYPDDWQSLAKRAGKGLRALLATTADLDEAAHTCNAGLLVSQMVTAGELKATGLRLIQDAIAPLAQAAGSRRADR